MVALGKGKTKHLIDSGKGETPAFAHSSMIALSTLPPSAESDACAPTLTATRSSIQGTGQYLNSASQTTHRQRCHKDAISLGRWHKRCISQKRLSGGSSINQKTRRLSVYALTVDYILLHDSVDHAAAGRRPSYACAPLRL